jgi:hypothetical protein
MCLFFKWINNSLFLVVLYVDDLRGGCKDSAAVEDFIKKFHAKFPSTDQDAGSFLGVLTTKRSDGGYSLSMSRYFENLLKKYGMEDCNGKDTPAVAGSKLLKADPENPYLEAAKFPYSEAIGELLWAIRCSRPDLKYDIGQLCGHMRLWDSTHVNALKYLLKHIKRTLDYTYDFKRVESVARGGPIELSLCTDSDFCGEDQHNDKGMRSLSSIVIFINGCGTLISVSSLQKTIARSTQEAEYIPMSEGAAQLIALVNCLQELNLPVTLPANGFTDNDACRIAINQVATSLRMRHLRVAYHFVKEAVNSGHLKIFRIDSGDNPADLNTKSLTKFKHRPHALFILKLEDSEGRYYAALKWSK